MQCTKCHIENAEGVKFCRNCGERLHQLAPMAVSEGEISCPSCGRGCRQGATFCGGCGFKLVEAVAAPLIENESVRQDVSLLEPVKSNIPPNVEKQMSEGGKRTRYIVVASTVATLAIAVGLGGWYWGNQKAPSIETSAADSTPLVEKHRAVESKDALSMPQATVDPSGPTRERGAAVGVQAAKSGVMPQPEKGDAAVDAYPAGQTQKSVSGNKTIEVREPSDRRRAGQIDQASSTTTPTHEKMNGDWRDQMRSELAVCGKKELWDRIKCTEAVRWKYCDGRWDAVSECKV